MGHIHELIDFTVGLYIIFDHKILLIEHPRYGKWMAPGGHIELDEDPEQSVLREAFEETGLDVEFVFPANDLGLEGGKKLPVPQFMEKHQANPPHQHISLQYVLRSKNANSTISDEHTNMRWFSLEDLSTNDIGLDPLQLVNYAEAIRVEQDN
jgi:8-oxo-dGTP pyrophosphatase MutT (NUDIX family)